MDTSIEAGGAAASTRAARRVRVSLRAKGIAALAALILYSGIVAVYVAHEREKMLHIVNQVERLHTDTESLIKMNTALTHAIVALQDLLNSNEDSAARWTDVLLDIQSFESVFPKLRLSHPDTVPLIDRVERDVAALDAGQTRAGVLALRDSEQELAAQIEKYEDRAEGYGRELSVRYADLNRYLTVFVTAMNLFGLVVFGTGATVFFSRVAADMRRVEERALAVAGGYRGAALEVTRDDEVGVMMDAVNQMQRQLGQRERQQEITRQERFHQEKMAAIGSLASAVAHEVGNPINSISGIAQHTLDSIRSGRVEDAGTIARNAELTLGQTERIAAILRNLSDLSSPRSPASELLDLNELLKSTCSFIRYDARFRSIDLLIDTQPDLPAVRAVADHVTQVLMNLLINAADAMDGITSRRPAIRVSTRRSDGHVLLVVADNGHGMDEAVLTHAFDDAFTTKPVGKGRGIGLYLCKTLIEEMGGRIELASSAGSGTVARIHLPLEPGA
ncbi:MAG: sensor histidine kinase [Betaproteobacteria bacterium]